MRDQTRREIFLEFFKACGFDIDELTPEIWKMVKDLDYRKFIEPMVRHDKMSMTKLEVMTKYDITRSQLDNILYVSNKKRPKLY